MSDVLDLFATTTCTVWPYSGRDQWGGGATYGTPYQILATFDAKHDRMTSNSGQEFVSTSSYWTSDTRPQYLDRIAIGEHSNWQTAGADEIRSRRVADASVFGVGQTDIRLAV